MSLPIKAIKVWIQNDTYTKMLSERAEKFDYETGGILLGYRNCTEETEHWVVTNAVGPGHSAKHGKFIFTPDYEYHVEEAERHFNDTLGKEYYLGDWHTHPNASPRASWLDRVTILRNAKRANHTNNRSLMIIIGGQLTSNETISYIGSERQTYIGLVAKPIALKLASKSTNNDWLLFHNPEF
ncbi:Mov34/MPN/PAD-1 family protein [Vibrio diabolicus]|uniref:Mov34/MPN/PAD-1 family protein n=1 Tax=Vibrio diabolicus TaxID=50719 RepID=UPI00293FF6A7|nr:Mov34/MPN/PAD-1 family protein [Vibrio diabolicus]MDV5061868.1 Mov34/MPN/PAD-1 family protein [Vibrio diabolicus]